jgi:GDP-D-mannose dehydratase
MRHLRAGRRRSCEPSDISVGRANPEKALKKLVWKAEHAMPDVVKMMIAHELKK